MRGIPRGPVKKVFSSPRYPGFFSSGTCNPWPPPLKTHLFATQLCQLLCGCLCTVEQSLGAGKMATGLGIPSLAVQSQMVCLFPVRNGDSLHTVTRNSSLEKTLRLWLDRVPLVSEILPLFHFLLVPRRHKLHLFPSPQQCSYIVCNVSPWPGM